MDNSYTVLWVIFKKINFPSIICLSKVQIIIIFDSQKSELTIIFARSTKSSKTQINYRQNKLLSRSCAVCISHCFGGPQVLQISLFPGEKCFFPKVFFINVQCLFPTVLSGSQDSVRLLRVKITHCPWL